MLLKSIFLLVVLSLESSFSLPFFFIYWAQKMLLKLKEELRVLALFVLAFCLATFYSLSWPLLALCLLASYFVYKQLEFSKLAKQVIVFVVLHGAIFILGNLQFNYFYLFHLLSFVIYFYRNNLKHYAP